MDDAQCILLGVSAGLVLDGRIYSADAVFRVPGFHLNTADIEAAHVHLRAMGSETTEIRDGRWFNFKDPDGNVLMICECWQQHGAAGMPGHCPESSAAARTKVRAAAPTKAGVVKPGFRPVLTPRPGPGTSCR